MPNPSIKTLAAVTVTSAILAATPGAAAAQTLNMDMSWGIRSQMQNWAHGQQAANAAAMNYLRHMQALRARGYTGPSLPTGVTPESLRNSINAMNNSFSSYNQAQMQNSQRTSNAVHNYSMQAIRGCWLSSDRYGQPVYLCP